MKTKLYRIDNGVQYGPTEILVATFEKWSDAETAAIFFASSNREDFKLLEGKRSEIKRSYLYNECPNCSAHLTYNEVAYRKDRGTKRCDCGCLFAIDWTFQHWRNETRLRIMDISKEICSV